jgi:hypothetical protein
VIIGLQGGRTGEIDLGAMMAKRATAAATTLRTRTTADKASIVAGVRAEVWPLIEAKKILAVIDRTVPMSQAAIAHEIMATSDHIGKVLLVTEPRPARPDDAFVEAAPPPIEISPAIDTAPSGPAPETTTETAPGTHTDAAPEPPRATEPLAAEPPLAPEPRLVPASPHIPASPTASLYISGAASSHSGDAASVYTSDAAGPHTSDTASVYTSDNAASESGEPADRSDTEPPAETNASDGQDAQDQAEPAPVIARGSAPVTDAVDARRVTPQTPTHRTPQQTPRSSTPPQSSPSAGEETPASGHTGNTSVAGPTH